MEVIIYKGIGPHTVTRNGKPFSHRPSLKVFNHSPTGFSTGYHGSGPAQLALALLLDHTDKETAVRYHQDFKREFVACWPGNGGWSVDSNQIRVWLEAKRQEAEAAGR